ncbi:hypothetical protein [Pseudomonas syringae]|uniref:hypothetical protein n=1 Tax=Pseudomonas syringae TaxID=317 RepID=UPI00200B3BB3|nr:hypothetical protein [Pseudomonas syringae]MCK9709877.1 hypothetical protein [Pseudomonas syringae pv. syringae]
MKLLIVAASMLVANTAVAGYSTLTINAYEVCGAYSRNEPGSVAAYESAKKVGFEMDHLCKQVKEELEGEPSPADLPKNIMAQFYDVPESQVTTQIDEQDPRGAVVSATSGQSTCRFKMARLPNDVVPTGWAIAGTSCSRKGGGGIPIIDGSQIEELKRQAEQAQQK